MATKWWNPKQQALFRVDKKVWKPVNLNEILITHSVFQGSTGYLLKFAFKYERDIHVDL